MDFFENSYYHTNKRILSYLGQWPLQNRREKYFFRTITVLIVGSIVVPKIIKFIECRGDLNGMIQCIPALGLHSLSAVNFLNCSINEKKLRTLTRRIEQDWIIRSAELDDVNLKHFAERARILTIVYGCYIFGTLWMYLLLPGVPIILDIVRPLNQSRGLIYLFETEYFIDQDKYYFFILIHAYITMPFSVGIIIAFDTMFAVYVHHVCGIFATLGSHLKRIGNDAGNEKSMTMDRSVEGRDIAYEQIVSCIKMHKEAVEFIRLLESANSLCLLLFLGIGLMVITVTGFMTVTNLDKPGEVLRFGTFTMAEIMHVFYICWQGQMLMEQSEQIFIDAYNVQWYDISPRAKRLLILIMMRSSDPCKITAGKIYVLSMENFSTVLKTAMSYFTVLMSMN